MAQVVSVVRLKHKTLDAFESYIREAEAGMQPALEGDEPFLWTDLDPERARRVRKGEIPAQLWDGAMPVHVPDGLIHDWVGALAIGGVTIEATLGRVQDYDHHKDIYKPEVMESRLVSRSGNDFKIFLLHHHLLPIPGTGRERNIVNDAGDVLEVLVGAGTNLVLSGHKHVPWVWRLQNMYVVNTGTVATLRLRGDTKPCYNIVEIKDGHVTIERRYPFHGGEPIVEFDVTS